MKNIAKHQNWNELSIVYLVDLLIRDYVNDTGHGASFDVVCIVAKLNSSFKKKKVYNNVRINRHENLADILKTS